jgi:hypothetical protein
MKSKLAMIEALVITYIIHQAPSQLFKRNIHQRNTPWTVWRKKSEKLGAGRVVVINDNKCGTKELPYKQLHERPVGF